MARCWRLELQVNESVISLSEHMNLPEYLFSVSGSSTGLSEKIAWAARLTLFLYSTHAPFMSVPVANLAHYHNQR